MNIKDLETAYSKFSTTSMKLGNQLADNISMLQLDDTNQNVVEAVLEIEKLTNKKEKSFLRKLPLLGRYVGKAEEAITEEKLRNSNITEVVGRLFSSLESKKNNIIDVMEKLYTIKEQLSHDVDEMIELEHTVKEIASSDLNNMEVSLAKNLMVQVTPSIIKAKDRIGIIDTTCRAAQATTQSISGLLPSLQGELITEMAIQGGLNELKEFKELFDNTMSTVHQLTKENQTNMGQVLEDVIDLSVTTSRDIVAIENSGKERAALHAKLKEKMAKAVKKRDEDIQRLDVVRENQQVLTYTPNQEQ